MAAYLPEDNVELRAGDRAPEAPRLKSLAGADDDSTSLFSILKPTHHTVLLFNPTAEQAQAILGALSPVPKTAFRLTAILPPENQSKSLLTPHREMDNVLVDTEGHAFSAYHPVKAGFPIIVVRPDGAIGAVVKDKEGLVKYLKAVLSTR